MGNLPRGQESQQLWGVPAALGGSQQLSTAVLRAAGVELLRSTGTQLIRPKTGGSDKGSPNAMFIFSLQLFSGSQSDSLKQEVSFKTGQW